MGLKTPLSSSASYSSEGKLGSGHDFPLPVVFRKEIPTARAPQGEEGRKGGAEEGYSRASFIHLLSKLSYARSPTLRT